MTRARDAADQINRVNSSAANATAITIDSSENVLVGKTSAGYNVDGFEARQNGETYVSRSGTPMAINRNSSDGALLNLYKDGTAVGSIASQFGTGLKIDTQGTLQLESGSNNRNLYFDFDDATPNFYPSPDDTLSIGRFNRRFKDLYLSGGVYLGGTGAVNKLDDYEEGTWTPTWIVASGSITANSNTSGRYTKIGRVVTVMGYISFASQSGASGAVTVGGLPFTAVTTGFGQSTNQAGGVTSLASGLFNSNCPNVGRIPANTTTILPVFTTANGGTALDFSNLSQQTNHSQFVFQGQYIVNS